MKRQRKTVGVTCVAMLAAAITTLAFTGSASATLSGEYTKFAQCPWTTEGVFKCIHSVNEGGEVVLGSKKVPIVNQVTIQGGYAKPVEGFSKFFAAKNGITLSKAGQPVPGGLAGIVPSEKSPFLVKALIKFFFENSLTGVNSVLELAKPASDIKLSETNLTRAEGVAMKLPVKVRLENPFLGKNCYVGSSTTPINWELTSATTNPPKPNGPISGNSGEVEFIDGGRIIKLSGNQLVDNAWSAPSASGCGGILGFLVNPIVNSTSGLPAAAGTNTAILKNTIHMATANAVKKNDEL
jgi:hypothetical protein